VIILGTTALSLDCSVPYVGCVRQLNIVAELNSGPNTRLVGSFDCLMYEI